VFKGGEEPEEADGKSVMQMIILAATEGTPLRIEAEGEDAEQAVAKLIELVEGKFGEE
jgi:phosphotransferase system HPr (HPr) family protein